jgi:NhaC family Na+:H+ antiporter
MAAALGVPASSYLIYCFFNLLNPLISFLFSLVGIGNVRAGPAAGPQERPIAETEPQAGSLR